MKCCSVCDVDEKRGRLDKFQIGASSRRSEYLSDARILRTCRDIRYTRRGRDCSPRVLDIRVYSERSVCMTRALAGQIKPGTYTEGSEKVCSLYITKIRLDVTISGIRNHHRLVYNAHWRLFGVK